MFEALLSLLNCSICGQVIAWYFCQSATYMDVVDTVT